MTNEPVASAALDLKERVADLAYHLSKLICRVHDLEAEVKNLRAERAYVMAPPPPEAGA